MDFGFFHRLRATECTTSEVHFDVVTVSILKYVRPRDKSSYFVHTGYSWFLEVLSYCIREAENPGPLHGATMK